MKIRGNTVGTTMPRPDWDQTNPRKADYIRNKPVLQPAVTCTASDTEVTLRDSANQPLLALTLDTTGLTLGEAVNIEISGKNFINPDNFTTDKKTNGDPKIIKGDNWVQLNFANYGADPYTGKTGAAHTVDSQILSKLPYLPDGEYTLSFSANQADAITVYTVSDTGEPKSISSVKVNADSNFSGSVSFSLETASRITLRRSGSNSAATIFYNLQLERGTEKTSYEPYHMPQTVTIEANGGMVDVLEQNPSLMSYKTTTIIRTPENGDLNMDVEYVADTKTYIDNKFAKLATALAMN